MFFGNGKGGHLDQILRLKESTSLCTQKKLTKVATFSYGFIVPSLTSQGGYRISTRKIILKKVHKV